MPTDVTNINDLDINNLFYQHTFNQQQIEEAVNSLNDCQRKVYDSIYESVMESKNEFIFIEAPGGTGKTYLINLLLESLAFQNKNVTACASSGIASILLKGGGTLHRKLKIPIQIDEDTICNIKKQSALSQQLKELDMLVWDEACMFNKHVLEWIDRSLQDLRNDQRPFGGLTIVLSGDWRQILPVVKRGNRAQIVDSSLKKSILWKQVRQLKLTENMRVKSNDQDGQYFKDFLLKLGDGALNKIEDNQMTFNMDIPERFIFKGTTITEFVDEIFPSINYNIGESNYKKWITERAIIVSKNDIVDQINKIVLNKLDGEAITITSFDCQHTTGRRRVKHTGGNNYTKQRFTDVQIPVDYLNSIEVSGMPPHKLILKIGAPVMLLKNMYPDQGHCNGTRYIVKTINPHSLELEVAIGPNTGETLILPKLKTYSTDGDFPFTFYRKQFPVKLCFAFTANKSQGQSLNKVGICLFSDFFSHGQLYVAMSRATDPNNVHILLKDKNNKQINNAIYNEIFDSCKITEVNKDDIDESRKNHDYTDYYDTKDIQQVEIDRNEEAEFLDNLRIDSDEDF